jgi:hypothetical protein
VKLLIRQKDIIYLAGFFDGEGCISIVRDKTRLGNISYRLRISANQVDRQPIDLLKECFGGLIQVTKKSNPKHRPIYSWQQHSQKALSTLVLMLPYLRVKKEQAEFAINWVQFNHSFKGKKKTPEDIALLEQHKDALSTMKGYL